MRVKTRLSFQACCASLHIALNITSYVWPKEMVTKLVQSLHVTLAKAHYESNKLEYIIC
jgi:hypothetical protein